MTTSNQDIIPTTKRVGIGRKDYWKLLAAPKKRDDSKRVISTILLLFCCNFGQDYYIYNIEARHNNAVADVDTQIKIINEIRTDLTWG